MIEEQIVTIVRDIKTRTKKITPLSKGRLPTYLFERTNWTTTNHQDLPPNVQGPPKPLNDRTASGDVYGSLLLPISRSSSRGDRTSLICPQPAFQPLSAYLACLVPLARFPLVGGIPAARLALPSRPTWPQASHSRGSSSSSCHSTSNKCNNLERTAP